MDIDKIISAWEHCTDQIGKNECDMCPYNNDFNGCLLNLKIDTIKLLKFYKDHEHEPCVNCPVDKDYVQIVRCKDCMYSRKFSDEENEKYFCLIYAVLKESDWFCADGETEET